MDADLTRTATPTGVDAAPIPGALPFHSLPATLVPHRSLLMYYLLADFMNAYG